MAKTAYNISLKGYVGEADFDRITVDRHFAGNDSKQVKLVLDFGEFRSICCRSLDGGISVLNYDVLDVCFSFLCHDFEVFDV
jgi:hypothetical protein